jgi:hypothetical protein
MANNQSSLFTPMGDDNNPYLFRAAAPPSKEPLPSVGYLDQLKDPSALISHAEMCRELGISSQTGYDWRNPKSKRFKAGLAALAIYLSERTVRFRRGDVQKFALQKQKEHK